MSNADSVSAAFALLLGLAVHQHAPMVVAAETAASGPAAAIGKAHAAAAAESRRARESDAVAAQVIPPAEGAPPSAPGTKTDELASRNPTDTIPDGATAATLDAAPDAARATAASGSDEKFDASRHRDPFRPPNLTPAATEKTGPRTPLEGYEIGQLKLVGIVTNAGNVRAMVEDSAGLGYIVSTGTPIGLSGGVVRSIEQRRVLIQETTTNFYGEKQAKEVVMELPQEDRSP